MFNIIKMDLYKMIKSRSFYLLNIAVIVISLTVGIVVKLDTSKDYDTAKAEDTAYNEGEPPSTVVPFPSEDEYYKTQEESIKSLDVKEFMGIQYSGITMAFIAIFLALFVSSELDTGFIKNIAPLKNSRISLVISKTVTTLIFILIQTIVLFGSSAISTIILSGKINISNPKALAIYLGFQILLAIAFGTSIVLINYMTKSKAAAMAIGLLLSLNLQSIILELIEKFINSPKIDLFQLSIISNSRMSVFAQSDYRRLILISIFYFIIYNIISIIRVKRMEID